MADTLDELVDAVGAGFMADDVVLGLSRLQRGAEIEAHHRKALARAERALELLADPSRETNRNETSLRALVGLRQQADEVARSRGQSADIATFYSLLLDAFRKTTSGESSDAAEEVLDFFERLAEATQAIAAGHIVTPAQPAWTRSALTGIC